MRDARRGQVGNPASRVTGSCERLQQAKMAFDGNKTLSGRTLRPDCVCRSLPCSAQPLTPPAIREANKPNNAGPGHRLEEHAP